MDQGRLAAYHAFGEPCKGMTELQPIGIYSIPEVSYVGATEVDLTKDSVPYEVGVSRYRELAAARSQVTPTACSNCWSRPRTYACWACTSSAPNATEMVHIGQAVMGCGGTVEYLVDAVFNYPTFSEAYKVAALDVMNKLRALSQFRPNGVQHSLRNAVGAASPGPPASRGQATADRTVERWRVGHVFLASATVQPADDPGNHRVGDPRRTARPVDETRTRHGRGIRGTCRCGHGSRVVAAHAMA